MYDIEGLKIYVSDSFDTLTTLLSKEATFTAKKINNFNKEMLREQLRIHSQENEFTEIYISLIDEQHDMFNLQEFSTALGIKIPKRDPEIHPTYEDYAVRKGDKQPVSILPGSYAVIGKSVTGCGWEYEWWFINIHRIGSKN